MEFISKSETVWNVEFKETATRANQCGEVYCLTIKLNELLFPLGVSFAQKKIAIIKSPQSILCYFIEMLETSVPT